jgi:hypothetical protein
MSTTLMDVSESAETVAVVRDGTALALRPVRRRDRVLAHLRAHSLNDELARGLPPEDRWLRAVQASRLMSGRARLAEDWEALLAQAESGSPTRGNAVPIRRRALGDAADAIDELVAGLRACGPVDVRGLAIADRLLTDGSGPVFRSRSPEHLSAAVAAATRLLRPVSNLDAVDGL